MKIIGIGDLVLDVYMNEKEIIGITSGMSFANVIYNITRLLKEDKNSFLATDAHQDLQDIKN